MLIPSKSVAGTVSYDVPEINALFKYKLNVVGFQSKGHWIYRKSVEPYIY